MNEQLEMPRFTSTLRAFSSICKRPEQWDPDAENKIIRQRVSLQVNAHERESARAAASWPSLVAKLMPSLNEPKVAKLKSLLDKLRSTCAKQFLNEDFNEATVLNEAALFLVEKFYEFRVSTASFQTSSRFKNLDKLNKKLREKFGPFQRNLFDACKELMESLFAEIELLNKQEILDDLFSDKTELLQPAETQTVEKTKYFGENINVYSFYEHIDESDESGSECEGSDDTGSDYDYETEANESVLFNFPIESVQEEREPVADNLKYIKWTTELSKEMCSIVYEMLAKEGSINQIQNELVELLGFENIELSEYLFSNREQVVSAYKTYLIDGAPRVRKTLGTVDLSDKMGKQASKMTLAVASDITVHTESEKKIKKLMRKEEKKINKYNQTKLEMEYSDNQQFDPELLRMNLLYFIRVLDFS